MGKMEKNFLIIRGLTLIRGVGGYKKQKLRLFASHTIGEGKVLKTIDPESLVVSRTSKKGEGK